MTDKLEPCPFCGNDTMVQPFRLNDGIWCVLCRYCTTLGPHEVERADAIVAWNKRKPDAKGAA